MIAGAHNHKRRLPVIKISLPYLYRLAEELEPLARLQAGTKIQDNMYVIISANVSIDSLLTNSFYSSSLRS